MNKGVIFVRVSKREQDYQRKLEDLRALVKTQNLEIVAVIAEKVSGAKNNEERDGVQELLRLAQ
jgi:DNA invertase Pin-like site-specific DNA recombinase